MGGFVSRLNTRFGSWVVFKLYSQYCKALEKGKMIFIHEVFDNIQKELQSEGSQLPESVWNDKTRYISFHRKGGDLTDGDLPMLEEGLMRAAPHKDGAKGLTMNPTLESKGTTTEIVCNDELNETAGAMPQKTAGGDDDEDEIIYDDMNGQTAGGGDVELEEIPIPPDDFRHEAQNSTAL